MGRDIRTGSEWDTDYDLFYKLNTVGTLHINRYNQKATVTSEHFGKDVKKRNINPSKECPNSSNYIKQQYSTVASMCTIWIINVLTKWSES